MKFFIPNVMILGIMIPVSVFAKQEKPNIILIMTDQQSADAMSCAGNPDLYTPNMDKLASRGVRFENAYCTFPISGPSRSSIFTGYMPSEIGQIANGLPLPDSLVQKTLGTIVSNAGYECAYAGKWHVHTNSLPEEKSFGFERLHLHNDFGLAESCVGFLKRKHDTPFFLVASFDNPHNICEYARKQNTPYADIKEPEIGDCPNLPDNFQIAPYDADVLKYEKSLVYRLAPTSGYTFDDWRRYRNAYFRLVETVDKEIGKILDEIDRQNLWENTVIIFTSDHGDGQGAHQWNQKTALYEEIVNVPFIVCLPGGKNSGKVLSQFVSNGIDIMPSVCDWAGTELPSGRKGLSVRNIAEKGDLNAPHRPYVVSETVFTETGGGTKGWMVRTDKYKYVLYDKGLYREQLYDMQDDRSEMVNLAVENEYLQILQAHRKILSEWMSNNTAVEASNLKFIPKD